MKSTFLNLKNNDLVKGAIIAGITVILTTVTSSLEKGSFPTDMEFWKGELVAGLMAMGVYLSKNLLSNSNDQFLKKEGGE